ncbi:uncharacterized protein LOC143348125 [Colletes latitarsis]|uniref:uncharacterized protein LOC143348125 n=1 Tax=Colletes latitarsis TaxID=2605962 RepID=UPI00403745C9
MPREDAAEIRSIDQELEGEDRVGWNEKQTREEKAKRNGERANGENQTDLSESTGLTTCLPASRYATGWSSLRTEPPPKKPKIIYTCSSCHYTSNRQYNVKRHEERIHLKLHVYRCCKMMFFTKGDYYIHCEQLHPEKRTHAITSRTKYKITTETVASIDRNVTKAIDKPNENSYNLRSKTNLARIMPASKDIEVKSNVNLKYSITYTSIDIENIPLINLLSNHRRKSYLKGSCPSKLANKTNDISKKKAKQTIKIAFSTKESIEKTTSENGVENIRKKVSNSSSFSVELPTKKLILKRFRTSLMGEFQLPMQDQNNNICSQMRFVGEQTKEIVSMKQTRLKNSNRSSRKNKENVPTFRISMEKEELHINVDSRITAPMAAQLQRDYLAPMDFEKYKIF